MVDTQKLEQMLSEVGELPAMPDVVSEVLRATDDPSTVIEDVCEILQRDPVLAARILRISNSPYYGMRQHVGTLKLALVILGIREVRNTVLGVSVIDSLGNEQTDAILSKAFWDHAVIVAGLARKIGALLEISARDEAFVSGLLHDVGKMVLARQLTKQYSKVYRDSGGSELELCEAEQAAFGFTHAEAAACLTMRWNLPQTLTDAICMHHYTEEQALHRARDPQLAAVVRLADRTARCDFSGDSTDDLSTPGDLEAWGLLEDVKRPLPEGVRKETLGGIKAELAQSPLPSF